MPVLLFSSTCLSAGDATLPGVVSPVSARIASGGLRIQMVCNVTTTFQRVHTAVTECDVPIRKLIMDLTSADVSSAKL